MQPKWLKPIVEVRVVRVELTTQEVLLEHSDLLGDLWGLLKSQLKELKGLRWAVMVMGSTTDNIVEQMSWMEEGSGSGNDGACDN